MQEIAKNLYIGDVNDALAESSRSNVDVILYFGQSIPEKLCYKSNPVCIHMPLRDGRNGSLKIRRVLFTAYMLSLNNDKILVACRAGISRSVLVCSALVALSKGLSFDEAYSQVKAIRNQSQPEFHLMNEVKKITEELKCCI